jgi:hypothetical protein
VVVVVVVAMAMAMAAAVAVRVTVLVVTVVAVAVAVARAFVPFTVLVAKPLDDPCDLPASLFRVDLVDAGLVQVRGDRAALVLTGRRLRAFTSFRDARGVCFPSERYARSFFATGL